MLPHHDELARRRCADALRRCQQAEATARRKGIAVPRLIWRNAHEAMELVAAARRPDAVEHARELLSDSFLEIAGIDEREIGPEDVLRWVMEQQTDTLLWAAEEIELILANPGGVDDAARQRQFDGWLLAVAQRLAVAQPAVRIAAPRSRVRPKPRRRRRSRATRAGPGRLDPDDDVADELGPALLDRARRAR